MRAKGHLPSSASVLFSAALGATRRRLLRRRADAIHLDPPGTGGGVTTPA